MCNAQDALTLNKAATAQYVRLRLTRHCIYIPGIVFSLLSFCFSTIACDSIIVVLDNSRSRTLRPRKIELFNRRDDLMTYIGQLTSQLMALIRAHITIDDSWSMGVQNVLHLEL